MIHLVQGDKSAERPKGFLMNRRLYVWFYDKVFSRCYDLVIKWCFLPLGQERVVRRALVRAAGLRPGTSTLETCCGTGGCTLAVAKELGSHAEIKAIDISRGQIAVAVRKNLPPNVEFAVMDASATSFPDGRFENVVIPHALHEMPRPQRLAVLREARRVLVAGGKLVVMELDRPPNLFWRLCLGFFAFYWLPFNFETATRKDMLRHGLTQEVIEAGFEDVCRTPMYHGALQVVTGRK